jgi:5-(carboxyamino)imidazole ribonucleotide mutase
MGFVATRPSQSKQRIEHQAIGKPGAANAALFAAEILALTDEALYERLAAWRAARAQEVLDAKLPE